MKLPNAHIAIVESDKIAGYLLNPAHPDNGGKAAFFIAGGFCREEWGALAAALCELGLVSEVVNLWIHCTGGSISLMEKSHHRQAVGLSCELSGSLTTAQTHRD